MTRIDVTYSPRQLAPGLACLVLAATAGVLLQPARLEVSFLPPWLRWTGVGWGAYWVVDRPEHGRYAIVSEGRREYLWVLSRTPELGADDRQAVRARLQSLGFDLERLKDHPQEPLR